MAFWRTDAPRLINSKRLHKPKRISRPSQPCVSRTMTIEPFEQRLLLSINFPQLISVIPNEGAIINNGDTLHIAPTQLTLHFNDGEVIDPATLGAITITRAGSSTPITSAVVPNLVDSTGFRGIGDNPNDVVIRFDRGLPSDVYDINISGVGALKLLDTSKNIFNNGATADIKFTLDLGAQVASVVPQPVTRDVNGKLTQALGEIDVYFTTSTLAPASAQLVTNYELINTKGTANNTDDTIINPTSVVYSAATNMAQLMFTQAQLNQPGTYRLRVGNNDPLPVAPTAVTLPTSSSAGPTLTTSYGLGNLGNTGGLQSLVVSGGAITNASASGIQYPGNNEDPSHRNIPISGENQVPDGPGGGAITEIDYNFQSNLGTVLGNQVFNQITAQQKQDARAIFALYAKYLGVQFVETPNSGITVATSDPRLIAPTLSPGAVAGIANGGIAIINNAINWGNSEYGGSWFTVAMHEIGHSLGYAHADDAPPLTIMNGGAETNPGGGSATPGVPAPEPVFPGDVDIANGQHMYRPDANDVNMYSFTVTQAGTVSLETIAQRMAGTSLLNTVLTLFDKGGNVVARNDDYFGTDSLIKVELQPGTYYVGVTSTGNTAYNPLVAGTGSGGTSQGNYQLHVDFQPDQVLGLANATGTLLDGDANGSPGGTFNFWFQVQDAAHTIYVDKTPGAVAPQAGATLYNNLSAALAAASKAPGDVVRVLGNTKALTDDTYAYNIGYDALGNGLSDGTSFGVPKGVTVMVDGAGGQAIFKLSQANVDVGTVSQGIDHSQGALQILGTPPATGKSENIIFTSYNDQTVAPVAKANLATVGPLVNGDWGGIVFHGDSDYESQGIFLNTVDHALIEYGGGQVSVGSTQQVFDPINLTTVRPLLLFNTILNSADAAMSGNPNAFQESEFQSSAYTADYGRVGPVIHGNILQNNAINGMFVGIHTPAGGTLEPLSVSARFDDKDIVYVIEENLTIAGAPTSAIDVLINPNNPAGGTTRQAQIAGRLAIDPGVVVKFYGARIETQTGNSQLIAEGTASNPIIMTSLLDTKYGAGGTFATSNVATQAAAGNWAGLFFGPATSASLDYVVLQYAGGVAAYEGGSDSWNPIEIYQADVRIADSTLQFNAGGGGGNRNGRQSSTAATIFVRGAQPTIVNNVIQHNGGPAISINVNALNNDLVNDLGRSTGTVQVAGNFINNYGPLVRLNKLLDNSINGMVVRGGQLTTESIWDDTDIVHVVQDAIVAEDQQTFSGLQLRSSSTASLVVKLQGQFAGFTASGRTLDVSDRIGGTVQIIGQPGHPVVLTSLADDTVGAGTDPKGNPVTDTNNNGAATTPQPGDWGSVTLAQYSNDTNLLEVNEYEQGFVNGQDTNNKPLTTAQSLGALAPNINSGNDTQRLGFEVNGTISQPSDVDVYSFTAQAGTQVWMQIDRTSFALDSVLELVNANGVVLARSNNSFAESSNPALLASYLNNTNTGRTLSQGDFDPAVTDPYSINAGDAGMRVVLGGAAGTTNTYYVRVRSATDPVSDPNMNNVTGGLTSGAYTLQLRLQQQVMFPGSVVQFANLDYSTSGVSVIGQPNLSPLLGESESSTADHSTFASAQDLGNLLSSNQSTVAVGGNLASSSQVDWYKLTINYDLIQRIGGLSSADRTWAAMFDMDYADGLTRADTTLSVFDSLGNLIFTGRDSDVADDQPRPTQGADTGNQAAGSEGALDPFIGTVQLPVGASRTYYIAVSSSAQLPTALDQTYGAAATNPLIRLEPVDSVNRVVEDHVGDGGSGTAGTANTLLGSTLGAINANAVAYKLSDVVMFLSEDIGGVTKIVAINPATGQQLFVVGGTAGDFQDIAMRNDGELYGLNVTPANSTDANSANYTRIDTGTGGTISTNNAGITTFQLDATGNVVPLNTGVQFYAEAFGQTTMQQTANTRQLFAIGSIPGGPGNLLFQLDPNTGAVIGPVQKITLPTNVLGNQLFTGQTILTSPATGAAAANDILDGQNFTINGGSQTVKFEFDSGPSATLDNKGGLNIRDGKSFTIDGKIYEYDEGLVFNINGDGTLFNLNDTFTITNTANPAVTTTFQFITPGNNVTTPGYIAVNYGPGFTNLQMTSAIVTAINSVTGATGVSATQSGAGTGTRINLSGESAIASATAGMTVDPASGLGVAGGHIAIPFTESDTVATVGTQIVNIVDANDKTVSAGFARDHVNFYGAASADFSNAPTMTDMNTKTGVTAGSVAVPFLFSDTAAQISQDIATAINNARVIFPGFTTIASAQGTEVSLENVNSITLNNAPTLSKTGAGPGGLISGMAYQSGTYYAVSDAGGFYTLNTNVAALSPIVNSAIMYQGSPIHFTSLSAGPVDASSGQYAKLFFATDDSNHLFVLDAKGNVLSATTMYQLVGKVQQPLDGAAVGMAFSTLDYNLWHVTTDHALDAGHGITVAPDNSRLQGLNLPVGMSVAGGQSFYFGLDTPDPNNTITQPDNHSGASNYSTNPTLYNTYNLPGGAHGSVVTNKSFSLSGYAPQDKPTLYFNYKIASGANATFAVSISSDGGATWNTLASTAGGALYISSDGGGQTGNYRPGDDPNQDIQTLWTNTATWRQARVDLGNYAGQGNLILKFDFNATDGLDNAHEGAFFDDLIVGFSGRGEMVTDASPGQTAFFAVPTDPRPTAPAQSLTGPYQLEIRRGTEYGETKSGTKSTLTLEQSFDINARFTKAISLVASAGISVVDRSKFSISDGINTANFEFVSSGVADNGFIAVNYTAGDSAATVANSIVQAVNQQSVAKVQASNADPTNLTSKNVDLFGAQHVNGIQATEYTGRGDTNTPRLQGYTLITNNNIANALQDGILVAPAPRTANGDPLPGSPRVLPVLNSQGLVPGVSLVNNVISNSGQVGIHLLGDAAAGVAAAAPFIRVVNNTIYGGNVAKGVGVLIANGAAPTLMNNIIANTATAIQETANGPTDLEANLYKGNTSNGAGGGESFALQLAGDASLKFDPTNLAFVDPLFIDAKTGDFYLAPGSKAIHSSLDSLQERPALASVENQLGLPPSPILAPTYDLYGQLRANSKSSSTPGVGQNVFIDRGAIETTDTTGPTASLLVPTPTDPSNPNSATVSGQTVTQFAIQFSDGIGTGINDASVTQLVGGVLTTGQFTLTGPDPTNNNQVGTLVPTTNFLFSYDSTNKIVRFSAAQGIWIPGTYTITINNSATTGVTDLAGNVLKQNNINGLTQFTITIAGQASHPFQNPANKFDVNGNGSVAVVDAVIIINALKAHGGTFTPAPGTATPPFYDVNGDGVVSTTDAIAVINFLKAVFAAKGSAASPAVTSSVQTSSLQTAAVQSTPAAATNSGSLDSGTVSQAAVSLASTAKVPASTASTTPVVASTTSASTTLLASTATGSSAANDAALASQSWQDSSDLESTLATISVTKKPAANTVWQDDIDYLV